MSNLSGQVAVVTGAAQGLGKAIAIRYADAGMRVVVIDVKEQALTKVQAEIESAGGTCLPIVANLADIDQTQQAAIQVLEKLGTPRVLVHNAAILNPRPLAEVTLDEWLLTVNVQLQAAFILVKAYWQGMTDAGGGSIVLVSSQSGITGFADEVPYCAGKHGLEGMMKALALEGEPRNIAVNTITPGMYMNTPMSEQNYPDELKTKWVDPMVLTPAFLHLAGITASELTGERLNAWELSQALQS